MDLTIVLHSVLILECKRYIKKKKKERKNISRRAYPAVSNGLPETNAYIYIYTYLCIKLIPQWFTCASVSPLSSVSLIRAGLEPNIYIILRFCHSIERV